MEYNVIPTDFYRLKCLLLAFVYYLRYELLFIIDIKRNWKQLLLVIRLMPLLYISHLPIDTDTCHFQSFDNGNNNNNNNNISFQLRDNIWIILTHWMGLFNFIRQSIGWTVDSLFDVYSRLIDLMSLEQMTIKLFHLWAWNTIMHLRTENMVQKIEWNVSRFENKSQFLHLLSRMAINLVLSIRYHSNGNNIDFCAPYRMNKELECKRIEFEWSVRIFRCETFKSLT